MPSQKPLKLFISYAHEDKALKNELLKCLATLKDAGEIDEWYDGKLTPGLEWEKAIDNYLSNADIVLYLASRDSLDSKQCNEELAAALESEKRVIPIILRPCDWKRKEANGVSIADFQALPEGGEAIRSTSWKNEDEAWQDVTEGLHRVVDSIWESATPEKEAKKKLDFANAMIMLGLLDKALKSYTEAIELDQNYAEAYNNRGVAYAEKSEYDRAIKDYNKAIELDPNNAKAYSNRGVAYAEKGEYDRAIKDYNKAIELDRNNAIAYSNRGAAYSEKGEYDRSIKDYNKAIELNQNYAEAYYNRGNAYVKKGEYDRAIKDYNKAIELNQNYAKAYDSRGTTYFYKGEYDRAIKDYNKAIELNQNYAEAYYNRGIAYVKKGEYDRSIKDYIEVIERDSNDAEAYYNRGVAYAAKSEHDRAGINISFARKWWDNALADLKNAEHLAKRSGNQSLAEAIAKFMKSLNPRP